MFILAATKTNMNIRSVREYKLKGERNNRPRRPLVIDDKVFVIFVYDKKGFVQSRIQCLSTADFSLVWEYTHDHVINNIIALQNKTLLASCMDGHITCFDLRDGKALWTLKTTGGNVGPVSNEWEKRVVFSGIQGTRFSWCVDTTNGSILWKVGNNGHSYNPTIFNDTVFNSIGNELNCLDLATGATIWKAHEPRTYLFNPKIVGDLVAAPGHGLVNMYHRATGALWASIETGQPINTITSSIREVLAEGHNLYFGDQKGIFYGYSLNPASKERFALKWKAETNGAIESIPALVNNGVLVINDAGQLLCLDQENGQLIGEKKTKGTAGISGITFEADKLFFSCSGGHVSLYEVI